MTSSQVVRRTLVTGITSLDGAYSEGSTFRPAASAWRSISLSFVRPISQRHVATTALRARRWVCHGRSTCPCSSGWWSA